MNRKKNPLPSLPKQRPVVKAAAAPIKKSVFGTGLANPPTSTQTCSYQGTNNESKGKITEEERRLLIASREGNVDEIYSLLWKGTSVNCRLPKVGST